MWAAIAGGVLVAFAAGFYAGVVWACDKAAKLVEEML